MPAGRFHGIVVKLRRAKLLTPHGAAVALSVIERGRRGYHGLHRFGEQCQVLGDRLADVLAGAETAKIVDASELRINDGSSYIPTKSASFKALMERLPVDYRDYAFFDFGSGKGRMLVLASRLPFQKIIGIELSKSLMAIAERNVRAQVKDWESRGQLLSADASGCELPSTNSVYYFYNPFGRETMGKVIGNIASALARKRFACFITYLRPEHADLFLDTGLFVVISSGVIGNEPYKILRSLA